MAIVEKMRQYNRLSIGETAERHLLQFVTDFDPEPGGPNEYAAFPAYFLDIPIEIHLGAPIATGAFKLRLWGHHDGRRSTSSAHFIGFYHPNQGLYQIDTLIWSYLESRTVDKVYNDSMCSSSRHGIKAEVHYKDNPVREQEELCLLVTGRCVYCYQDEASNALGFEDLIPDAGPARSWNR